ncbi:integrase [Exiguobacterium sp. SH0S1]|uniref:tyrosine-type recombinase/integrase n=1 Tax=Exiguobacterium sp. SH0S1 TaxID=2510949 RepID=UPI00103E5877|nr:tyrosine-type recombinase/integrase [Exiguobacterium sp. SH0S1]TCI77803.1 integrase [Exiguobacterium sp. SH0S1]
MTFKDAVARHLAYLEATNHAPSTIKNATYKFNQFETIMEPIHGAPLLLSACTEREDVIPYVTEMKHGRSGRTLNNYLSALRTFYDWAIEEGHVATNPFKKIYVKDERGESDIPLTKAEVEATLERVNDPVYRALLTVQYYAGLRVSEVTHLTLSDVDWTRKVLLVRKGKGNKTRTVPMSQALETCLATYIEEDRPRKKDVPYVFPSKRGRVISTTTLNSHLKAAALEATGLEKTSHKLRRAFASQFLEATGEEMLLADILGHENLNTTRQYVMPSEEKKRAAVEKMMRQS